MYKKGKYKLLKIHGYKSLYRFTVYDFVVYVSIYLRSHGSIQMFYIILYYSLCLFSPRMRSSEWSAEWVPERLPY